MSRDLPFKGRTGRTCRTCRTKPTGPVAQAPARASARRGYTLIELISVAALATLLLALAVGGYHTWTRDHGVEAAQRMVLSTLHRARAHALARNMETRWLAVFQEDIGARSDALAIEYRPTSTNDWRLLDRTNALPNWIVFHVGARPDRNGEYATNLVFQSDGRCRESDRDELSDELGWLRIGLRHSRTPADDKRYHRAVEINRRTGLAREAAP